MYYKILENKMEFKNFRTRNEVANEIGIAPETLSRVLSGKQSCSKTIAYCITKLEDNEAMIKDYFVREEE